VCKVTHFDTNSTKTNNLSVYQKTSNFADENNSDMNIQNCLNGSGLERCLAGIEKIEKSCFFLLFCCMLEKKCTFANSWLRQRKEKRMDYQDVKDGTTVTTPPAITD
jgi:hypothetical protein